MEKSDIFLKIKPQVRPFRLKDLTLYELYRRRETNTRNMELLKCWLDDIQDPVTYDYWVQFDQLRKRLNRSIYLKELKVWLFSLVGR